MCIVAPQRRLFAAVFLFLPLVSSVTAKAHLGTWVRETKGVGNEWWLEVLGLMCDNSLE